jgi:hypothetical protein
MRSLKFIFFYIILSSLFLLNSCKKSVSNENGWIMKDLLTEGVPLKILTPKDVIVKVGIENHYKKISLKGGKDYFIEIIANESGSNDLKQLKSELLMEIKQQKDFSKIIDDAEYGFLFEKKKPDGQFSYDFRYLKSDAYQQFVFQTGMYSDFSLSQAKNMYQSLKKLK